MGPKTGCKFTIIFFNYNIFNLFLKNINWFVFYNLLKAYNSDAHKVYSLSKSWITISYRPWFEPKWDHFNKTKALQRCKAFLLNAKVFYLILVVKF